ncbi:MAG: endonuclease domain-containing protein [Bauldia sp.]|jgi:very-short-patch-repair endonuclease|nr:endonuclease domain-containing protein [Bauldia sp.]
MRGSNPPVTQRSRRFRRSPTDAERRLWYQLRDRRLGGFKFVRQEPIGPYVADFCCREAKLIVEVDGSQHANSKRDLVRDAWLANEGYRVLRFWNVDVLQRPRDIGDAIIAALPPHPNPLPARRGEGDSAEAVD